MSGYILDGLEVDMLSLGDADAILVSRWRGSHAERVLIDAGSSSTAASLRPFLATYGISYLDHVVVTHPHDDHAAGVIELLREPTVGVGRLWFHSPFLHVNVAAMAAALRATADLHYSSQANGCLQRVLALQQLADARRIPWSEPFAGQNVGFLFVCGPSASHYQEVVVGLEDPTWIRQANSSGAGDEWADNLLEALSSTTDSDSLLAAPQTTPENDLSVILWTRWADQTFLFTGDVGAQGLIRAASDYSLVPCHWFQIPHHGSRRNISEPLIRYFSPRFAYVSAEGSHKHPRQAVVNAFKNVGSAVYSTHYPKPGHQWFAAGSVPPRAGYGPAVALWEQLT